MIKLGHEEIGFKVFLEVLAIYGILALALVGMYYLEPTITGFATVTKQINYTDEVNLEFDEASTYVWNLGNPGDLKSVMISGSKSEEGIAKVYIEEDGLRHLIFDSSQLVEDEFGVFGITGFVVKEKSKEEIKTDIEGTLNDEQQGLFDSLVSDINETKNNVEIEVEADDGSVSKVVKGNVTDSQNELINELSLSLENSTEEIKVKIESEFEEQDSGDETVGKIIDVDLEYGNSEFYDANNDGVESLDGIVDFSVADTGFNWEVDESNLCTRYEVFSVENQESGFACFGSGACCNFVSLEGNGNWNDSLFLSYGGYGSTENNLLFAQVLYVDFDLSVEDPYTDIAYSSWRNLTTEFTSGVISFEDVCIDSCVFDGNESSYNLIVELENGSLNIDEIGYVIEENVVNNKPVLIKDIEDISLAGNGKYTLVLNEYFTDTDDDELVYSYSGMEDITVRFEEGLAYVIPDEGFTGSRSTFITASDEYGQIVSNVFEVVVGRGGIEFLDSRIVDGEWVVSFATLGSNDLSISVVDGTYAEFYNDNASTVDNLDVLGLKCGEFEIFDKNELIESGNISYVLVNGTKVKLNDVLQDGLLLESLYVENYQCDGIGHYKVKVLSGDVNTLEFKFGDEIKVVNSLYGLVENFEIRDNEDNKLFVVDSFGNLNIKGNLISNASADSDDFVIEDADGSVNLVLTNPLGDLQIRESLNQNLSSLDPGPNSFVIRNKNDKVIAYVNVSGSLFLNGILTESVSFG